MHAFLQVLFEIGATTLILLTTGLLGVCAWLVGR